MFYQVRICLLECSSFSCSFGYLVPWKPNKNLRHQTRRNKQHCNASFDWYYCVDHSI